MLLWLAACSCAPRPPAASEVTPSTWTVQELTTRFYGEDEGALDPRLAFSAAERCPRLRRARLEPERNGLAQLRVEGTGLGAGVRVAGALPDGTLVDLLADPAEGGLSMPIVAPDVEVWFGVRVDGRTVACRGPGYSLRVEGGRLVP